MMYRLYVSAKGPMLPPVELCSCEDQEDVLVMVQSAITQGYYEFVVVCH